MQGTICFAFFILLLCLTIAVLAVRQYRLMKKVKEIEQSKVREQERLEAVFRETLGNITHDLKTPLTAIHGYAQGILDGVAGTPDRLNKYIMTIRNKADDMEGLVDELSLFAKIYKKDMVYQKSQVDVNEFISGCMSNLSLDLETKKIDFLYQSNVKKGTCLYIDTEKVKRVLYNIVGNASKFMATQMGLIYVQVEEKEKEIWIRVKDNGVGIDQNELPFIFDRFYRADSSRNSKKGGSGLGLAIAKKIIEDHGGKIYAESEKERGTRISFSLPKNNR